MVVAVEGSIFMTNQKEMHNTVAMEGKRPDLGTLSLGDLMEVIKEYPWFGAARKELCARMSGIGVPLAS